MTVNSARSFFIKQKENLVDILVVCSMFVTHFKEGELVNLTRLFTRLVDNVYKPILVNKYPQLHSREGV